MLIYELEISYSVRTANCSHDTNCGTLWSAMFQLLALTLTEINNSWILPISADSNLHEKW